MVFDHISEAIKLPDLVKLDSNLYVARFETMKIYSALGAVKQLLDSGKIDSNTTLIDSSSGIYAYALALACHRYGLKCHIVGSITVDQTLLTQLHILGATVDQIKSKGSLKMDQNRRVEIVQELLAKNPDYYWMRQYHDNIHYLGYEPVAQHISDNIGTANLSVVGCVGSGCSTGGLIQSLRKYNDDIPLVGIQPFGSVTFGSEHVEDPGIIIAGIGSSIQFDNVSHEVYDELHWISFGHALSGTVALLRDHAIFAGLSSGCGYLVAKREAELNPDRNILFLAPDMGHRYMEGVFAHHSDALPIETLSPTRITDQSQLALPWACMSWGRKSAASVNRLQTV